jgi:hypothetical protein
MKKLLLSVAGFAAIVLAVALGYWFLQPHPRIDDETANRIKAGMTEADVIAIIGAPPGNYSSHSQNQYDAIVESWGMGNKIWLGQECTLVVLLGDDGKVHDKEIVRWESDEAWFDRFLFWFDQRVRGKDVRIE